jgi:hypothetical protein
MKIPGNGSHGRSPAPFVVFWVGQASYVMGSSPVQLALI